MITITLIMNKIIILLCYYSISSNVIKNNLNSFENFNFFFQLKFKENINM